jgi:hypothetical protein
MTTTKPDRMEEIAAIAAALNNLREHAEKIDAGMLAFLIAQAMDEANSRAVGL